jgi:hypothetical protein
MLVCLGFIANFRLTYSLFQTATPLKMTAFWNMAPCSAGLPIRHSTHVPRGQRPAPGKQIVTVSTSGLNAAFYLVRTVPFCCTYICGFVFLRWVLHVNSDTVQHCHIVSFNSIAWAALQQKLRGCCASFVFCCPEDQKREIVGIIYSLFSIFC